IAPSTCSRASTCAAWTARGSSSTSARSGRPSPRVRRRSNATSSPSESWASLEVDRRARPRRPPGARPYALPVALTRVRADSALGPGQMDAFFVDDWEVLVVRDEQGVLHALDGVCPHEETPLVYGDLSGAVLTCLQHFWSFDVTTGRGINPPGCRLTRY